ncbi:unnamed protein product [Phytophthora fragariaefolia]|uniref:Unnamed protein product n=1 Tax=Phytophthora fragariaefolia TaxID=1490495 RepID=A0A9W6UD00_9STRA|nr:unnamed protein product [Phytophthora fragariaefolia]
MLTISQASLMLLLAIISFGSVDADNLRYESRRLASTTSGTMLALVNAQRATRGLAPLCLNSKLMAAAKRHSKDMAANNFMSHTGSDGSSMSSRISDTGFEWTGIAENVAAGQTTVKTVMASWMSSSGHRRNILGGYTMFGTALAYSSNSRYGYYWTQDFGEGSSESCDYEDTEYTNSTESADGSVSFEDVGCDETPHTPVSTGNVTEAALIPPVSATARPNYRIPQ